MYLTIQKVNGREILDSRGNPTVEAEVTLTDGTVGKGIVPSGASTGEYEALELRDGEQTRYLGKGTTKAVENIQTKINEVLKGMNAADIYSIDEAMKKADGTEDKSVLGANAMLAVSMASVRAAAKAIKMPLYQFLGGIQAAKLPMPMMNILNGGCHAKNRLDFQEFMIMPVGAKVFPDALRMGVEVYHQLREVLLSRSLSVGVGDEGGFAPEVSCAKEAFALITEAVRGAGYEPGKDIVYTMDAAASELYQPEKGGYYFAGEGNLTRTTTEMIALYEELTTQFPLVSIEDGLDQKDWEGWKKLTERLGDKVQLVGDDLFVTNPVRLSEGIEKKCANAILIKPNQIGTVSETLETIRLAKEHGYRTIISHRSGETEDTFIADLAVAVNAGQIKTGAPCRSERVAKYNQLLRLAEGMENGYERNGKQT